MGGNPNYLRYLGPDPPSNFLGISKVWVTPQQKKTHPQEVGPFGAELATWLSATDHAGTFGAGFGGRGGGVKEGAKVGYCCQVYIYIYYINK